MNRLPLSSINFPRNTYFVTFLRVMNLSATDLALPCLCILSCFAWKQLVPFNYGHNITIYILFSGPGIAGFFSSFPNGISFIFQYLYSANDKVHESLVIEHHAYWA